MDRVPRPLPRRAAVLALMFAGAVLVNCSGDLQSAGESDHAGTVGLQLQLGDVAVDSLHYVLANETHAAAGDIDVVSAPFLSLAIGGVPVGTGYTLTLTAVEADDPGVTCSGTSLPFEIAASTAATVSIAVTCRRAKNAGRVSVGVTFNECPTITSVSTDVPMGARIGLHVEATDPDHGPEMLTITWVGAGIRDVHSADPTLDCSAPGPADLTVIASDGDTTPECDHRLSFTVPCPSP